MAGKLRQKRAKKHPRGHLTPSVERPSGVDEAREFCIPHEEMRVVAGFKRPAEPSQVDRAASRDELTINWRTFDPSTIETEGDDTLIGELLTYKRNLDLLLEHEGEFVLIRGDEIVGYFKDMNAALDAGAERFGEAPALIKEIAEIERVLPWGSSFG